jgi:hypothetical protein
MASMSLDRPGRAVTSGTMSSPRCPVRASGNPGTLPQFPRQDTTGMAGYVAGRGRSAARTREVSPACKRGATADGERA